MIVNTMSISTINSSGTSKTGYLKVLVMAGMTCSGKRLHNEAGHVVNLESNLKKKRARGF